MKFSGKKEPIIRLFCQLPRMISGFQFKIDSFVFIYTKIVDFELREK